ncbi:hypothetical protein EDD15DRAFT_16271 [Pisolithus albus]|nr:hypothetical protein EDD15DRAFT_16271 [Pisolithus albus]
MSLLKATSELDLVVWPHDRGCDRTWLLDNVPGSTGLVVMLTDRVDSEVLGRAGPSLKIVSTMSVGYERTEGRVYSRRPHGCSCRSIRDARTDGKSQYWNSDCYGERGTVAKPPVVAFYAVWSSAKYDSLFANAQSWLRRLRSDRPSDPGTACPVWHHSLLIFVQSIVTH